MGEGERAVRADSEGDVRLAFVLGWHVAELFHANIPQRPPPRTEALAKLPGLGELDDLSRALLLVDQIKAELRQVGPWLEQAGQAAPDPGVAAVEQLLKDDPIDPVKVRSAVALLHRDLLLGLTVADFRLGKAYGLGRALLETATLPDAGNRGSFTETFGQYRLTNLAGWLTELKSAFPQYAVSAVQGSLQAWSDWTQTPVVQLSAGRNGRPPRSRPVDWSSADDRGRVTRALRRQGTIWRALLSGEKHAVDLLAAPDYVSAAEELLRHLRRLAGRFVLRFWLLASAFALVLAGVIWGLFAVHATAKIVALLGAGAATLGVSFRGVSASLGKTVQQVQGPLWASALQSSVTHAATSLPVQRQLQDGGA